MFLAWNLAETPIEGISNTKNTTHAVYKAVCRASSEVVVLKCYALPAVCELYQHQIYREVWSVL